MATLLLILLALFLADKAISYYCTTLGLLYYLGVKHSDMPDAETLKELRNAVLRYRIRKMFGNH